MNIVKGKAEIYLANGFNVKKTSAGNIFLNNLFSIGSRIMKN